MDTGEWVTGLYWEDSGEISIGHYDGTWYDGPVRALCSVDPLTVGRCTGIKDMNGKLIFEGDITKQDEEEQVSGAIGVVYWDKKYGGWSSSLRSLEEPGEIDELLPVTEINEFAYICGNIYDTPDLINGTVYDAETEKG